MGKIIPPVVYLVGKLSVLYDVIIYLHNEKRHIFLKLILYVNVKKLIQLHCSTYT